MRSSKKWNIPLGTASKGLAENKSFQSLVFVLTQLHFGQWSILFAKLDCPVAIQNISLLHVIVKLLYTELILYPIVQRWSISWHEPWSFEVMIGLCFVNQAETDSVCFPFPLIGDMVPILQLENGLPLASWNTGGVGGFYPEATVCRVLLL